jgi:hypothetical protein
MEEKPKQWRPGYTLRYLLFEMALWALVCGAWLFSRGDYIEFVGLEVYMIGLHTLLGAAVGGLIGRPGVGAFV